MRNSEVLHQGHDRSAVAYDDDRVRRAACSGKLPELFPEGARDALLYLTPALPAGERGLPVRIDEALILRIAIKLRECLILKRAEVRLPEIRNHALSKGEAVRGKPARQKFCRLSAALHRADKKQNRAAAEKAGPEPAGRRRKLPDALRRERLIGRPDIAVLFISPGRAVAQK